MSVEYMHILFNFVRAYVCLSRWCVLDNIADVMSNLFHGCCIVGVTNVQRNDRPIGIRRM
eukprot:m.32577 g.32577  ORF g.32577 m.32577 type:complete len:60 (-) comp16665_c1_seq1:387-566(-)